jgi:hypothetical protein
MYRLLCIDLSCPCNGLCPFIETAARPVPFICQFFPCVIYDTVSYVQVLLLVDSCLTESNEFPERMMLYFFMSWQYYLDLDPWAPFDFGGLELNRLARTAAVSAAISATMTFARNRALGNGHRHGIPSRQIGKVSNPKSPNCLQEKRRIEVATCCCLNIFKIQMRLQSEISPFLG